MMSSWENTKQRKTLKFWNESLFRLYISNSQNLSTKYFLNEVKLNDLQSWFFVSQEKNLKKNEFH